MAHIIGIWLYCLYKYCGKCKSQLIIMFMQGGKACSYRFWFYTGNFTWWKYAIWKCPLQAEPWDDSITWSIWGYEKWNLVQVCKVREMMLLLVIFHVPSFSVPYQIWKLSCVSYMISACAWRATLLPADTWMELWTRCWWW